MTEWLGSIALLAFVMAATPGPNNLIFAASGASSGFWRTVPMLAGMLLGFVALVAIGLAGAGGLWATIPGSRLVLTAGASTYLAFLAYRLWHAVPPASAAGAADPTAFMRWWQMALFQVANPKTLLAVMAFITGKLGPNSPSDHGDATQLLGAACFLLVVAASASLWTLFGAALRSRLRGRSWQRAMRVMAGLAVLTIPTFWWT